jgi:hypothetical protein
MPEMLITDALLAYMCSGSAGSDLLFNHHGCLCDDPNLCWPQSENSTMYELTNNVSQGGPGTAGCL